MKHKKTIITVSLILFFILAFINRPDKSKELTQSERQFKSDEVRTTNKINVPDKNISNQKSLLVEAFTEDKLMPNKEKKIETPIQTETLTEPPSPFEKSPFEK